jgi:hypothetical protein
MMEARNIIPGSEIDEEILLDHGPKRGKLINENATLLLLFTKCIS